MKKLLAALLLGVPGTVAAQTTTLAPFVAADAGVRGSPVLLGVAVGRQTEHLGVRWAAAVDAQSTLNWSDATAVEGLAGLLGTELDAQLFLGNALGEFPLDPYAFGGVGMRLVRDQGGTALGGTASYGAGARTPLSPRLALEGEARYRRPVGVPQGAVATHTTPGWEFRAGMSLRFGSLRDALPPRPAAPRSLPAAAPALAVPAGAYAAAESAARLRVARGALDYGDDFVGTRYTWGGNTPDQGFDCSGFVRYIFRQQGVELPRVSRDQARTGIPLPLDLDALEPGDLLAFASDGHTVDHIAVYAGDGRILHSSSSGRGVRYDDLRGSRGAWYVRHMVAARRVIQIGFSELAAQ